ncbi:MAG: recombination protein O N-terminal domain-containing protein [Candidatus Paceibacterota bacterium]
MAIEKYTTACIVIESFDQNEHDRVYKLFTREFGLIMAHAKSVRKLESKLRAHVLPRGISLVTLVQGKEIWRLVGAEEKGDVNIFIHEVSQIIKRFIRGEGAHKSLYDRLILFLEKVGGYDEQKARLLLYYLILVDLGYADAKAIGAKNIKEYVDWSVDDLYTHLLLSFDVVREHVHAVLKEMQL